MTIEELRALWEKLKGEARELNEAGKIDEAEAKINEMRETQKKIDNLVALEEAEKRNFKKNGTEFNAGEDKKADEVIEKIAPNPDGDSSDNEDNPDDYLFDDF